MATDQLGIEQIEAQIKEIVGPLIDQLEAARAERRQLEGGLERVKSVEKRLEKTIEGLTGEPAPGKKIHGNSKKANSHSHAGVETVGKVRDHLATLDPGEDATAREISEATGLHTNGVRGAIAMLREAEEIRKTRKRRAHGSNNGIKADAYALMNGAGA